MILKVDRIDEKHIICIDKDKKYFAIEKSEITVPIEKGYFIVIDDNGNLTVSKEKPQKN